MKPRRPVQAALIGAICLIGYCAAFWPFMPFGWNRFPLAVGYSVLLSFGTIGVIMDGSLGRLQRIHLVIWFCTTSILAAWLLMAKNIQAFGLITVLTMCIAVAFICWIAFVSIRGWIKVFFWT